MVLNLWSTWDQTVLFNYQHTDEAKDVTDGGHEDNEQVDEEDETKRNADVHHPAEGLVREQDLEQSPADLQREEEREEEAYYQN